jgi:Tfp pilus assembly protein PilO
MNYSRYQHYYRQIWRFYEKPSAKISIALILTVVTIIFFAVFAIRPTLVTIAELLKTIHDRQEIISKLETKSTNLAKAQQTYLESSDNIAKLSLALPEEVAVQEIITGVEAIAAQNQLVLDNLTVSEFEYRENNQSSTEPSSLPVSIKVSGEYLALERFLSEIIKLPRFTTIESMSVTSLKSEQSSDIASNQLQLEINLSAYYQPSEMDF